MCPAVKKEIYLLYKDLGMEPPKSVGGSATPGVPQTPTIEGAMKWKFSEWTLSAQDMEVDGTSHAVEAIVYDDYFAEKPGELVWRVKLSDDITIASSPRNTSEDATALAFAAGSTLTATREKLGVQVGDNPASFILNAYAKNETTGKYHKLVAVNGENGYVEIALEQTGVDV